jgi:hypothetical protein
VRTRARGRRIRDGRRRRVRRLFFKGAGARCAHWETGRELVGSVSGSEVTGARVVPGILVSRAPSMPHPAASGSGREWAKARAWPVARWRRMADHLPCPCRFVLAFLSLVFFSHCLTNTCESATLTPQNFVPFYSIPVYGGVWLPLLKFSPGHIKRLTFK